MVLKKPISSHVAKGTVNEGYTSTSDQMEPRKSEMQSCACLITGERTE